MDMNELRRARDKAGLTSAQMAARLGVNVDTYRSWELGRRTPREDISLAVAAIAAGNPTPRDEIAALRQVVAGLTERVSELAAMVVRLDAEVAQLAER